MIMLQLLCRNDVEDWSRWKEVFDGNHEDRSNAGLSLLQIWRDTANPQAVWFLLEVADKSRAEAYMDGGKAGMHADRAGVTAGAYHFLETA